MPRSPTRLSSTTAVGLTGLTGPSLRPSRRTTRHAMRRSGQLGNNASREKPRASPTRTRTLIGTTKCQQAMVDPRRVSRADEALEAKWDGEKAGTI
jgi:hypothetical protein